MDLTLHPGEGLYQIRAVSAEGIQVNNTVYSEALIVSAETLIDDWPVRTAEQFSEEILQPLLELKPDLLLIGTGSRHQFLDQKLSWLLLSAGIGVEVMTTAAACRTFNIVMSEGRNAVAALLPLDRREDND